MDEALILKEKGNLHAKQEASLGCHDVWSLVLGGFADTQGQLQSTRHPAKPIHPG